MKKIILIIVFIAMFGWAMYDYLISNEETNVEESNGGGSEVTKTTNEEDGGDLKSDEIGLQIGKVAPDFALQTLKGETVRLSDYRGKKVIVNFWATWCPPCRAEIPDFQKLYENNDVEILAVNLTATEQSKEHVSEFVEKFGMTFPVLVDEHSFVTATYQVRAYPTSFMVDSSGRIQFVAMGAMNYDMMLREVTKMN
jgi:peroxiredoxin